VTRVLVVEDSATQAVQLRRLLEREGFEVEVATDGAEGVARCRAASFDVVLSDVVMPELSGYDVCRHLKADAATREIPVILLTTLNEPTDIVEALECGADNFITKPYELGYLLDRVRTVLANTRLRARPNGSRETTLLFMGKRVTIGSEKEQILGLLMASFEDTLRSKRELERSQTALEATAGELRARSDELARVNEDLEAYVYTVSHDLKEPLRGIEAFGDILATEHAVGLDDEGRRYLDIVRNAAARMRQLIDDLLTFSRLGRQRSAPVDIDLGKLVADVVSLLRFAIDEAGGIVEVAPELPTVAGHPVLLQQLFTNLLGNALKYRRPEVPPHIRVAWTPRTGGGIELRVADNGIGVPAEYRERVLGLFQRLHGREQYPGTGVGLAICKRVVEIHEGTIALDETPGGGCTVVFTLACDPRTGRTRECVAHPGV